MKNVVDDVVEKQSNFIENIFIKEQNYQQIKNMMGKENNYFNSEEINFLYKLRQNYAK